MSQEKVDYKKEKKKNRKEEVKKERASRRLSAALATVICVGLIGFVGYSLYTVVIDEQEKAALENMVTTPIDLSAISDYTSSLDD